MAPEELTAGARVIADAAGIGRPRPERGLTINEQVKQVVDRAVPHSSAIRDLVRTGQVQAWLQLVRYFGVFSAMKDGEEKEISVTEDGLEKLPGQHQSLGWHLDRSVLEFLVEVGAELDADEYG